MEPARMVNTDWSTAVSGTLGREGKSEVGEMVIMENGVKTSKPVSLIGRVCEVFLVSQEVVLTEALNNGAFYHIK